MSREELLKALTACDDVLAVVEAKMATMHAELAHVTAVLEEIREGTTIVSERASEIRFRDPFSCVTPHEMYRSIPPHDQDATELVTLQTLFPHPNARHWAHAEDQVLDAAVCRSMADGVHEDQLDWNYVSGMVVAAPRDHYQGSDRHRAESAAIVSPRTPDACQLHFQNGLRCWNGARTFCYLHFSRAEDAVVMELAPQAAQVAAGKARHEFWEKVAAACPGRTPFQVAGRYFQLEQKRKRERIGARFDAREDSVLTYFAPHIGTASLLTARLNLILLERDGPQACVRTRSEVERRCRTLGITIRSSVDVVHVEPPSDEDDDGAAGQDAAAGGAARRRIPQPPPEVTLQLTAARAAFGNDMPLISAVVFGGALSAHRLEKLKAKLPAEAKMPAEATRA